MRLVSSYLVVIFLICLSMTSLRTSPLGINLINNKSNFFINKKHFLFSKIKCKHINTDQQQPLSRLVCNGQGIVVIGQLAQLACAVYCQTLGATGGVCNDSTCYCKWS